MMKAASFVERGRIALAAKPVPDTGSPDALIRITSTTICGADRHIPNGEYPGARWMIVGHEQAGIKALATAGLLSTQIQRNRWVGHEA
jgi:threonine dehydrogenase-like Zn-dependent dehydrogenase